MIMFEFRENLNSKLDGTYLENKKLEALESQYKNTEETGNRILNTDEKRVEFVKQLQGLISETNDDLNQNLRIQRILKKSREYFLCTEEK